MSNDNMIFHENNRHHFKTHEMEISLVVDGPQSQFELTRTVPLPHYCHDE